MNNACRCELESSFQDSVQ